MIELYYVQAFLPNGLSWLVAGNLSRAEAEDRARLAALVPHTTFTRTEVLRDYGQPREPGAPAEDPVVATYVRTRSHHVHQP